MKAVGGVGLLGFLAIFVIWMSISSGDGGDKAFPVQMAFGEASGNQIEMHAIVTIVMANQDRQQASGHEMPWPDWIEKHLILEDSAGHRVKLERTNNSKLIRQSQAPAAEFFLTGRLEKGQDYTFTYIPNTQKPEKYRCAFTAPAESKTLYQQVFDLVE